MKKLLVATTLITAYLSSYPSMSPPLLATVPSSRCDLDAVGRLEAETVSLRSIYVSEVDGAIQEVCIETNNAIFTISELGELTLLQRDPRFEVDYFTTGSREGKIRRLGNISFNYYTSSNKRNKIRRIGRLQFDYYTSGKNAGRLKQVDEHRIDYYSSGPRDRKLKRLGPVSFDYDDDARIETRGTLSGVNLVIVDLIDPGDFE